MYHSTIGSRVIKKKKKSRGERGAGQVLEYTVLIHTSIPQEHDFPLGIGAFPSKIRMTAPISCGEESYSKGTLAGIRSPFCSQHTACTGHCPRGINVGRWGTPKDTAIRESALWVQAGQVPGVELGTGDFSQNVARKITTHRS